MDDIYSENILEWSFPDLDRMMEEINKEHEAQMAVKNENEKKALEELATAKQELETIKSEYEKKLSIVHCMIERLENPLSALDVNLIHLLEDMLKRTIEKIIYKEIENSPEIINTMIKELSGLITQKKGMINVFISEADYQRIKQSVFPASMMIQVDPMLNTGDVVIQSNTSELRSKLLERIDQVVGGGR